MSRDVNRAKQSVTGACRPVVSRVGFRSCRCGA